MKDSTAKSHHPLEEGDSYFRWLGILGSSTFEVELTDPTDLGCLSLEGYKFTKLAEEIFALGLGLTPPKTV